MVHPSFSEGTGPGIIVKGTMVHPSSSEGAGPGIIVQGYHGAPLIF